MNFYSVIIGSELLNGRRRDSHFEFLNKELLKRGWTQKANFVIKDDPNFMEDVFKLIKSDKNSVMFCFGGIGSTPDDYTREVSAKVFSKGLTRHEDAQKIILEKMGEKAYPHRIKMADLPKGAKLLENPINKMPGYYLEDRFFFTPGFPNMAHPMVTWALDTFYPKAPKSYSCNFIAYTSEAEMIDIMKRLPKQIELSCLPQLLDGKRTAEIHLSSQNQDELNRWCKFFKDELDKLNINYKEI
jgi:molybdopterin-biosynthesis enzyme MoeA-like protein